MTHLMAAGAPHQLAFECCDLIVKGTPSRQHGLDHQPQLGMLDDACADVRLEPATTSAQEQTKESVAHDAAMPLLLGPSHPRTAAG